MGSKKVLIVGGGIGGLTLANALQNEGIGFDIVEKAPEFHPIGAGISLALNATAVLKNIGVGQDIDAASCHLPTVSICDASAETVRVLDLRKLTGFPTAAFKMIRRSDLQSALLRPIDACRFRMGTRVVGIKSLLYREEVTFCDGTKADYDVVVGADGVQSSIRALFFGRHAEPKRIKVTFWLYILRAFEHGGRFRESLGNGRRVGIVPLTGGDAFVFLTRNLPRPIDWGSDPQAIRNDFSEFNGFVATRWNDWMKSTTWSTAVFWKSV